MSLNGVFAPDFNGAAKLNSFWVYVRNGVVEFTYTGSIDANGVPYKVK